MSRSEVDVVDRQRQPVLVTGVPRSGTTWLARLLATAPGTVLAGREPMNPRGRQYGLGRSLHGWTNLLDPTARQDRALRLAYRGLNPWVYSRYGRRQWAGPLPRSRMIVKDPFAMLSMPAIVGVTGAVPVLVYRHPGAVLASYRRMGWEPDLEEIAPVVRTYRARLGVEIADLPHVGDVSPAEAMGRFWGALHEMALADADTVPGLTVVSHEELAGGGPAAGRRLLGRLGLDWSTEAETELTRESAPATAPRGLHDFDRSPAAVAAQWRGRLEPAEIAAIESTTEAVRGRLERARIPLTG